MPRSIAAHFDFVGSTTGMFNVRATALTVELVKRTPKYEAAQTVDPGEQSFTTVPAGDRTRDRPITSRMLNRYCFWVQG